MDQYDLVVIGSGPAGEKGACQAAYYGHRVAVIERRTDVGGAAIAVSGVPVKRCATRRCTSPVDLAARCSAWASRSHLN